MSNLASLTPFKKGHKKLGGRTKGTPNKLPRILREAVVLVAECHGSDGEGTDGLLGFVRMVWRNYPKVFLKLLTKCLEAELKYPSRFEPEPPPTYPCRLDLLTDAERPELNRLLLKARVPLVVMADKFGGTTYLGQIDPCLIDPLQRAPQDKN